MLGGGKTSRDLRNIKHTRAESWLHACRVLSPRPEIILTRGFSKAIHYLFLARNVFQDGFILSDLVTDKMLIDIDVLSSRGELSSAMAL